MRSASTADPKAKFSGFEQFLANTIVVPAPSTTTEKTTETKVTETPAGTVTEKTETTEKK